MVNTNRAETNTFLRNLYIGSMLFGLFFGAVIWFFQVHMGQLCPVQALVGPH